MIEGSDGFIKSIPKQYSSENKMIKHVNGDITNVNSGMLLHGCNMQGVMGSGVAAAVRQKWPVAFTLYYQMCYTMRDRKALRLGQIQYVHINESLIIVNGLTQQSFGVRSGGPYASLDAISECVETVCKYITNECPFRTLHMPEIGGLRGGLDFEKEVMPIIEAMSLKYPVVNFQIWHYIEI